MRQTLLSCALLIFATTARAECECLWGGSFVDVQGDTDLVASGSIEATKGNSVDLRIQRVLRGTAHQDSVRVWLKTGDYCRPEADRFPPGSNWVMALEKIDRDIPGGFNPNTPNISYGRVGDYSLSSCGGYWLKLENNYVTGALIEAPRWVHEPKMTPVLLALVAAFAAGEIGPDALLEASREDPALRELRLDTRAFLREAP